MGVTGFDWLFLIVASILCAAYCGAGYFIGRQHRSEDDTALLRRLAKTSRNAGYSSLGIDKDRAQLLADADEAEKWAEALEDH